MKVLRVNQNTRIWCATGVTRRDILELIVELAKRNNKKLIPLNFERDEDKCDVLSVTNSSAGNKDIWIIDSGCAQHISSEKKMFSSYILVQERVVFMGNFATSR